MRILSMIYFDIAPNEKKTNLFPFDVGKETVKNSPLDFSVARILNVKTNILKKSQNQTDDSLNGLLMAVARNRDRKAFSRVYSHFTPRVRAFIVKQGTSVELAEEITQDAMINVWRKAHQFDESKASASTWVFTIARNRRIDILRKIARPAPDPNDPSFVPDPEPSSFDVVDKEQEAKSLNKVIANLPEDQKLVLQLAFFKEKAHAEISAELNIPLGTVKSRIRLALKKIRLELERSNEH